MLSIIAALGFIALFVGLFLILVKWGEGRFVPDLSLTSEYTQKQPCNYSNTSMPQTCGEVDAVSSTSCSDSSSTCDPGGC
jgi:hypothetical protein